MIDKPCKRPSIRHQCELLELCRSGYYYEPCAESAENLALMRRLDQLHLDHPVYGSRRLTVLLRGEGLAVDMRERTRIEIEHGTFDE